eukprot:10956362-Lingulodinium_polyedra.AAC.1
MATVDPPAELSQRLKHNNEGFNHVPRGTVKDGTAQLLLGVKEHGVIGACNNHTHGIPHARAMTSRR